MLENLDSFFAPQNSPGRTHLPSSKRLQLT
jgi:hypothetical protein